MPYAVSHDVSPEEFQTAIEPPEPASQTSQELSKTRTYKYKSLSNHYIRLIQITSLGLSYYRIICRTISGASNPFLLFFMCQEMVSYKRVVLYIPYKKDKNRRVCTKFINLDLGLYPPSCETEHTSLNARAMA